jgi:hypothetical protein
MAGRNDSLVANNVLVGTLSAGDNGMSGIVGTAYDPTYAIVSEAGSQIVLYINSSDYKFYAQLRDKNSNVIYTSNIIDLLLETMVVNGRYDSETKCVILTLDNGNEISFSVADLVEGLQSEITVDNKLSSDLVDDTEKTNKFVTTSEKNTWNGKVGPTDYATGSVGGVIKLGNGLSISSGVLAANTFTYSDYEATGNNRFVSKGTLENVITGKGLVKNTDYATTSTGGVIILSNSYATSIVNGYLRSTPKTYQEYNSASANMFISKGTLENVLAATVGDIDSALDAINGEVIS